MIEQALQCLLLIALFSVVILGANALYAWIVSVFNLDDLHDLDLEDEEF